MARRWTNSKGRNTFIDKTNERSLSNLKRELSIEQSKKSKDKPRNKNRRK